MARIRYTKDRRPRTRGFRTPPQRIITSSEGSKESNSKDSVDTGQLARAAVDQVAKHPLDTQKIEVQVRTAKENRQDPKNVKTKLPKADGQTFHSAFKAPTMPTPGSGAERFEAYKRELEVFHNDLVRGLDADSSSRSWYFSELWRKWFPDNVDRALLPNIDKYFETVRVYYLPHTVAKEEVVRFTAAVPAICTTGDDYMQLVSADQKQSPFGNTWKRTQTWGGACAPTVPDFGKRKKFRHLSGAVGDCPDLLNIFERRRKRMTCIASSVDLFGRDGHPAHRPPQRYREKTIRRDIVVITAVGPQFYASYLDYADFVFSKDNYNSRLDCYSYLGPLPGDFVDAMAHAVQESKSGTKQHFEILPGERLFHMSGYLRNMKDAVFLWLRAFDDQVRRQKRGLKGYLQVAAVGCGRFANLPPWMPELKGFEKTLMPLLVQAFEEVLDEHYFPDIIKIGFCDWSADALFSPNKDFRKHISTIPCPKTDLCHFDNKEVEKYVCGILNPSNAFSWPGNALGYSSVEAEIGENTTLRIVQNWIHNQHLIDPRNHVAVDAPSQIPSGRSTFVKTPCIVADASSVQEYTWDGISLPKICGQVEPEKSP